MLLKEEDYETYTKMEKEILQNLSLTMDNWRCLDKVLVNEITHEYLDKLEVEDDYLFCDGKMVKNMNMFIAHIKREILSRS